MMPKPSKKKRKLEATNFYVRKLEQHRAILAPMAGFTDAPFRQLCRRFGSAWAVTEMVSAKALVLGQQQGIEIGAPYPNEPDLVIQVFGGEPEIVAEGGAMLYQKYQPAALDINMGCPVKKVTGKSCGSKLMLEPERAAAIVRALREAVPIPVSAKMRLGYDVENGQEVALALQEAGASLVAIHGRTAKQKYSGEANWQKIAAIAATLRIPVVGSGDVATAAQFQQYIDWGLGVMVARAAVGRPWLFAELQGKRTPDASERHAIIMEHAQAHVAWYSHEGRKKARDNAQEAEERAMRSFRKQLLRYIEHINNTNIAAEDAKEIRQQALSITTLAELHTWLSLPSLTHTAQYPHVNASPQYTTA